MRKIGFVNSIIHSQFFNTIVFLWNICFKCVLTNSYNIYIKMILIMLKFYSIKTFLQTIYQALKNHSSKNISGH